MLMGNGARAERQNQKRLNEEREEKKMNFMRQYPKFLMKLYKISIERRQFTGQTVNLTRMKNWFKNTTNEAMKLISYLKTKKNVVHVQNLYSAGVPSLILSSDNWIKMYTRVHTHIPSPATTIITRPDR